MLYFLTFSVLKGLKEKMLSMFVIMIRRFKDSFARHTIYCNGLLFFFFTVEHFELCEHTVIGTFHSNVISERCSV